MDFDSFITFILILLFFVGPTILKQWQKKQQKSSSGSQKDTGPKKSKGLFGKIGDQIRQFIKDLEEQALEAKRKAEQDQGQQTAWDDLREPGESGEYDTDFPESPYPESPYRESSDEVEPPYYQETEIKEEPIPEPVHVEPATVLSNESNYRKTPSSVGQFRSNQLQNAVIWSEILSKPIALRED